jgi:hypothetical protein
MMMGTFLKEIAPRSRRMSVSKENAARIGRGAKARPMGYWVIVSASGSCFSALRALDRVTFLELRDLDRISFSFQFASELPDRVTISVNQIFRWFLYKHALDLIRLFYRCRRLATRGLSRKLAFSVRRERSIMLGEIARRAMPQNSGSLRSSHWSPSIWRWV